MTKRGYRQTAEHALKTAAKPGSEHPNWKGDDVTPKGGRTRAQRMFPEARPCERCGAERAERHHQDGNTANNEAINIRFLCRRCHMAEDGRLARMKTVRAAVRNPSRGRFSSEDIHEMRRLAAEGWSQSRIAERFGVRQPYVSRVLRGIRRSDVVWGVDCGS